jgi:FlaA1/EpsC-like NDP-sugar epimerase
VPSRAELARLVTQRPTALFTQDLRRHTASVAAAVESRRILVIGGAGSIGSATVQELAAYRPAQLHVVDSDENALAELVRDLRSRDAVHRSTELRTTPLDFGSVIMQRLLGASAGYDLVLNFAAVKHVRSEKDVFSLLRMLEINVLAPKRLLGWLADLGVPRYFAVSTDKAANPVNMMGASKRVMELVMLDPRLPLTTTSARFANVAFSNGSLLDGWLRRLEKGQPWAVPESTRRYFVTPEESGMLCLLAATAGPDREVVIPDLDPDRHLRDLLEVAEEVLHALALEPVPCRSEDEARALAAEAPDTGRWPVLVTPLDTAGEKEFEEFAAQEDILTQSPFDRLKTLRTPPTDPAALDDFLSWTSQSVGMLAREVSSDDVIARVKGLVPGLVHRHSNKTLDARM